MANPESETTGVASQTLRGDAVGNTMYSERWILTQLIKLTEIVADERSFSVDFEEDLCTLWDMCADIEVIEFTMKHDLISLIVDILRNPRNPRLNEIMVGILGNVCTLKSVREHCHSDVMKVILDLLSCRDTPTLIQVMRVLQTFAWEVCTYTPSCSVKAHENTQHGEDDKNTRQQENVIKVPNNGSYHNDDAIVGEDEALGNQHVKEGSVLASAEMSQESGHSNNVVEDTRPIRSNEIREKKVSCTSDLHGNKLGDHDEQKNILDINEKGPTNVEKCISSECTTNTKRLISDRLHRNKVIVNMGKECVKPGSYVSYRVRTRKLATSDASIMDCAVMSDSLGADENGAHIVKKVSALDSSESINENRFTASGVVPGSSSEKPVPHDTSACVGSPAKKVADTPTTVTVRENMYDGNEDKGGSMNLVDVNVAHGTDPCISSAHVTDTSKKLASISRITTGQESKGDENCENGGENVEVVHVTLAMDGTFSESSKLWFDTFVNVDQWLPDIVYILNCTKNAELIERTWSLLSSICFLEVGNLYLCQTISRPDLLRALLESFEEFFGQHIDVNNSEIYDVSKCRKSFFVWTSIVYSFTFSEECQDICCAFKGEIMENIFQMLTYFNNFFPLDSELYEYLMCTCSILDHILIMKPYELKCLRLVIKAVIQVLDDLKDEMKRDACDTPFLLKGFKDAVEITERYLKNALTWLSRLHDANELGEFQDILDKLRAKLC